MVKLILFFALTAAFALGSAAQLTYPPAEKSDQTDVYHGIQVADPYRWLEDENGEATKAWVAAENTLTRRYLMEIPFYDQVKKRISELYNYRRFSAPFRKSGYLYFFKNEGLQDHAALYRQKEGNGPLELALDPNTFSSDGTAQLTDFTLSADGRYGAYGISRGGSDWETYYIQDMREMKTLTDSINWVKMSIIAWQGKGFYYSRYPAPDTSKELSTKNENHQVWYHRVGTSQAADSLVFEDGIHSTRFHQVYVSEDERFTYLAVSDQAGGFSGNALFYSDSRKGDKSFQPLVKEVSQFAYDLISPHQDKFIVQTNNGAPNGRIILMDPLHPEPAAWKTIIAEKKEAIQRVEIGGGRLFVSYLKDVSSRVYVHDMTGKVEREVSLPALGAVSGFDGRKEDTDVFYTFNSFTFPSIVYRYDVATGKSSEFRKSGILFQPTDYITRQVFYPGKDGTSIPMFIVYRKGLPMNGKAPTLLYAYGGFNESILPHFTPMLIPWLEQGGVYAVANIRGGGEYGEKWHEAGMLAHKQQSFDDFIAAAEYLISKKITSPERLAINGASNGGLLVAAVVNQRPDLFKVAVPEVGVMDMLRFQKFTIGWNWIAEYGSSDSASYFNHLYAYSPLHNIRKGVKYPAMLIVTADHDDRVVPAHSFKYTATLQDIYKGPNPILISIDANSGHGYGSVSKTIGQAADFYSFLLFNMHLGWKNNHGIAPGRTKKGF